MGILDLLDEYNIKTTFFLVDIWTQKYPELVKEIVARGHEIGNHSTSHPQMSKLNETQIAKELNTQADNVLAIAGVRPVLFRPPYGDYNNRVITTARAQGFVPIQWSVDSLDWKNRGAQEIINRATKVKSGDIVLYKQLNDINDIFWGDMYLLSIDIDGEEYITVKYIQKSDKEGCVRLVSQNVHHADKDVEISRIRALAFVKASIRMNSIR